MRTRALVTSIFASVGVLAVGWQVGANAIAAQTEAAAASSTATASSGSTGSASSSSTVTSTPTATPSTTETPAATDSSTTTTDTTTTDTSTTTASSDGVWTGSAYSTRWGDVQVQVTISGGQITDVTALQLTNADGKSVQISNRAAPILAQEVVAAQSASVSTVSGATFTSQAYLSSVQSALDQAGF